jgi:hypothetical protein
VTGEPELRAVAADGTMAALLERLDGASRVTVVDIGAGAGPGVRSFDLDGLVEPEAFATDGSLLYVIDHQAAAEPGAYRVRPLNLATGELETIVGPEKLPFTDDMNGIGRRQSWSPDGSRLYTLYIRQTHRHDDLAVEGAADHPASGHAGSEAGTDGFVHVLDLDEEWAFCLSLPAALGTGDLASTPLAVSPDGATIAVADARAGQIAFASTGDLAVTRTVDLPAIEPDDDLHLALTASHVVLGWGREAHWFDRTTLEPLAGGPDELGRRLIGFTSNGATVLAWLEGGSEPASLRPPTRSP